ncbi:putative PurR-regulated permease PerM [Sediminihabitans luteus]|uniref:Putative PurR-regulated permease PerM n=1 Tax=Sediminihabitans luteus TaxID=1138585 RepID=A0A2M9CR17_9CELL|nr:AI-2E family transporter [Sediminihabitans luteus]PJJ74380.1 putative PurR-regulated permease PerM [Sediminihabitans luteus]GIJ00254.1 AI-2E family transporter [Sediminihabitans luteus]
MSDKQVPARPTASAGRRSSAVPVRKVAGSRRAPAPASTGDDVPRWLRTSAGWSWRVVVLAVAVALVFVGTARIHIVFTAVFIALVLTAVLRPLTELLARVMPRPLATTLSMVGGFLAFAGLLAYVVSSVAGQWSDLGGQFRTGLGKIVDYLENGPLPVDVSADDVYGWIDNGREWVGDHGGDIASRAAESAGSVVEGFAVVALAIFCTVFFLTSGAKIWAWFVGQLPERVRDGWNAAGSAGWYTFSGYARGTVLVALTDGVLVAIFLAVLGVPLAAPLAVLVFIGAFIPIIGAPIAMVIAMVVALAADGVVSAAIVGLGIAGIGQLEGHVIQPLIMGKQVHLHPLVVAISVTTGTVLGGLLGAVVAVPLVAVAWSVAEVLRHRDEDDAGPDGPDPAPSNPARPDTATSNPARPDPATSNPATSDAVVPDGTQDAG